MTTNECNSLNYTNLTGLLPLVRLPVSLFEMYTSDLPEKRERVIHPMSTWWRPSRLITFRVKFFKIYFHILLHSTFSTNHQLKDL